MLISPPFLPTRKSGEADADWVERAMTQPAGRAPGSSAPEGSFPVSSWLQWHNGLHIQAPTDAGDFLPVRAIANGIVRFAKAPTKPTTEATDPLNYMPDKSVARTDNGIVIVEHEGEIGANGTTPTTFKFYSVYMHLSELAKVQVPEQKNSKGKVITPASSRDLQKDDKVQRKDKLGTAGQIYGGKGQIHFEICMNPAELEKLLRRPPIWSEDLPVPAPTADGRTDSVFGSLWFYVPQGTHAVTGNQPKSNLRESAGSGRGFSPAVLDDDLWVQITYRQGDATVRSYTPEGNPIGSHPGTVVADSGFEYNLYTEANKRHNSLDATTQAHSSPSGWYELLRFGRNLGSDPVPSNAAHWRLIPTAQGHRWVDLNGDGTFKFSDADFPPVAGWNCYHDDSSPDDQRCDSPNLKRRIRAFVPSDAYANETKPNDELLAKHLGDTGVRQNLRRTICEFPCEWDQSTIEDRYKWKRDPQLPFGLNNKENWDRFVRHLKAITLTADELPAAYKAAAWHLHATEFIAHMRQCGWLNREDLQRAIPAANAGNVQRFLNPLNQVMRKYLNFVPIRGSHFLGQVAHETGNLAGTMTENGNNPLSRQYETDAAYYAEPDTYSYMVKGNGYEKLHNTLGNEYNSGDGVKFRGRGSLQITGRSLYSIYWVYRGWLDKNSFDPSWWNKAGWWSTPINPSIKPAQISNPQLISARVNGNEFNPMDVGGWYWVDHGLNEKCDSENPTNNLAPNANSISDVINHYDTPTFSARRMKTEIAKKCLGDGV